MFPQLRRIWGWSFIPCIIAFLSFKEIREEELCVCWSQLWSRTQKSTQQNLTPAFFFHSLSSLILQKDFDRVRDRGLSSLNWGEKEPGKAGGVSGSITQNQKFCKAEGGASAWGSAHRKMGPQDPVPQPQQIPLFSRGTVTQQQHRLSVRPSG
jgi:hypothetical protein